MDERELNRLEKDLSEMEKRFEQYVRNELFEAYKLYVDQRLRPVERLIYGLVALMLAGVVTSMIGLVLVR